jgi:hypothetical protein
MNKKLLIIVAGLLIVGVLAVSASVSYAQGPGGGKGRGEPGGPNATMTPGAGCCMDAGTGQANAYRYGRDASVGRGGGRWGNSANAGNQGDAGRGNSGAGLFTHLPPAVEGVVPAEVVKAMQAGWLDEYNALATYDALIAKFGAIRPFVNIRDAEAQHMAAWEFLFKRYNLALPAKPQVEAPTFATVAEACKAAATLESANLALYDDMLKSVSQYPDVTMVITALKNASQFRHLPALQRCAGQ